MEKAAEAEEHAYILALRLACQGCLQRCDGVTVILDFELGKPEVELQVRQPRLPQCRLPKQLRRFFEVLFARSQEPKLVVSFSGHVAEEFRGFFELSTLFGSRWLWRNDHRTAFHVVHGSLHLIAAPHAGTQVNL